MRRVLVLIGCCVALAGCGLIGSKKTTSTSTTATTQPTIPPTTTSTVPQAAIEVRPAAGPVGTSFQLLGSRFQPGETVIFEIDFPGGKAPFKGPAHKALADGTVTTSYRVTAGNPVGTYQVKATGDKGTQAAGQFDVTTGTATGTTVAGRTTTTTSSSGHTTTTVHTTTTKKP